LETPPLSALFPATTLFRSGPEPPARHLLAARLRRGDGGAALGAARTPGAAARGGIPAPPAGARPAHLHGPALHGLTEPPPRPERPRGTGTPRSAAGPPAQQPEHREQGRRPHDGEGPDHGRRRGDHP